MIELSGLNKNQTSNGNSSEWRYAESDQPLTTTGLEKTYDPLEFLKTADKITIDKLTGCLNRNQYQKFINEFRPRHAGVVVFLDVNRFKQINDVYKHDFADKCLTVIGEKLNKMFRANYDRIFRSGGDEFVIFCENYDQKPNFAQIIEDKINALEIEVETNDGQLIKVELARGIAEFKSADHEIIDIKKLINQADEKMYIHKEASRGHNKFKDIIKKFKDILEGLIK